MEPSVDTLMLGVATVLFAFWLVGLFLWNLGAVIWIVLPAAILLAALSFILGDPQGE